MDIPSSAHSSRMIPGSPTKGSFKVCMLGTVGVHIKEAQS